MAVGTTPYFSKQRNGVSEEERATEEKGLEVGVSALAMSARLLKVTCIAHGYECLQ